MPIEHRKWATQSRTVDGGGSVTLADRNFFENCLRQTRCNRYMSRVDSVVRLFWARIVFFLLLRMSQRWRGLNAIGHFTGQHVAVMHPLGILSFLGTCTAATLWVGSSATDKLCATLRNPARSHHPVFPRWRRDKCTTCSGCFGAMCTALTCQPDVPVLGREKRQVGRSRLVYRRGKQHTL